MMLRGMRVTLGFALMTIGALGTMAGGTRASQGTGTRSNRPLAPRSASRLVSARPPGDVGGACGRESPTRDGDASGSAAAGPWIPGEGTLRAAVEARVHQLVAEQLGVAVEELGPEVSLTDDLAADSLDLLELALVVESEFAIALPQRTVDELRTCRDLVDAVMVSSNGRQRRERLTSRPLLVMARVVPARDQTAGLERVGELTPYAMEAIAEDAARAGRGARLEVTVSATADDVDLAIIRDELARLERRGVDVRVRRDAGAGDEA